MDDIYTEVYAAFKLHRIAFLFGLHSPPERVEMVRQNPDGEPSEPKHPLSFQTKVYVLDS